MLSEPRYATSDLNLGYYLHAIYSITSVLETKMLVSAFNFIISILAIAAYAHDTTEGFDIEPFVPDIDFAAAKPAGAGFVIIQVYPPLCCFLSALTPIPKSWNERLTSLESTPLYRLVTNCLVGPDWWQACTENSDAFASTNPLVLDYHGDTFGALPGGWETYTIWQYE